MPISGGVVHLPTVGTLNMSSAATGTAELSVTPGSIEVRSGGDRLVVTPNAVEPAQPGWQAARWLDLDGHTIVLEDLDPYRHSHDWKAEGRLRPDRVEEWRRTLESSWRAIQRDAPAQLAGLRVGLTR